MTPRRTIHSNPWLDVPDAPPFELPKDAIAIADWNRGRRPDQRLNTALLPDPILGDPFSARVVLLASNPTWKDEDRSTHADPRVAQQIREAYVEPSDLLWLRSELSGTFAGSWWTELLTPLVRATSAEAVRQGVCVLHLHNYHSTNATSQLRLSSSEYSIELAEKAAQRGAVVIALVAGSIWRRAPRLREDGAIYLPNSSRKPLLTPSNFPAGFLAAADALS